MLIVDIICYSLFTLKESTEYTTHSVIQCNVLNTFQENVERAYVKEEENTEKMHANMIGDERKKSNFHFLCEKLSVQMAFQPKTRMKFHSFSSIIYLHFENCNAIF